MDTEELASSIFSAVNVYIDKRMQLLEQKLLASLVVKEGPPGKDGAPGEQGPAGKDGEAIDVEALQSLLSRMVISEFEAIPKPKDGINGKDGDSGPPGKDGQDGADGRDGKDGDSVTLDDVLANVLPRVDAVVKAIRIPEDGAPGKDGINGKDGADGQDGQNGRDGMEGKPGRDAFEIEVFSAIDETRAYAVGTFGQHRGGLWRCRSSLPGLSNWDCVMNGFAGVDVTNPDERTTKLLFNFSNGAVQEHAVKFSTMLYRGIYKSGNSYARGDTVTRDGSIWHCEVEETKALPGASTDWKLIVKRGLDGKDGQRGERGERGPSGKG